MPLSNVKNARVTIPGACSQFVMPKVKVALLPLPLINAAVAAAGVLAVPAAPADINY
jgi:hypothetical protein